MLAKKIGRCAQVRVGATSGLAAQVPSNRTRTRVEPSTHLAIAIASALLVCYVQAQIIKPINGDPFIGMLETPVTSSPIVSDRYLIAPD